MFSETFKTSNLLHQKGDGNKVSISECNEEIQMLKSSLSSLRKSKDEFKAYCQQLQSNAEIQVKDFEMVKLQLAQKIIQLKMSRLESIEQ